MTDEPWWRGAVIYQIYPRSFFDSDDDGTGDLKGITAKLDYVASLGVDGVWLSPFFRSPMKDFGYDVSDYCDVDPTFGTLADFDALLKRAHDLGLKVIIDQVYSHTSNEHPWFMEAAGSADNPKADWYVWAKAKPDGTPPNNWQGNFGGPAWTWHPRRRRYYLHNFLAEQPDLNFHNPEVREALLQVAAFWLDRGVDGFRLDVANYYFHDAQLRDNPHAEFSRTPPRTYLFQWHVHDKSQPETLDFIGDLRRLTDRYPDKMMVGEIGDDDPLARQREYTDGPDRLHTAYSFHLLDARHATPSLFVSAIEAWKGAYGWPSWSLGNHDVPRFPTRFGGEVPTAAQVSGYLAALFALRGTIFVYQGDELGLPQAHVPFEQLKDPFAMRAYVGGAGRDGARTPMPWSDVEPMAGFTRANQTWLPIDPAHPGLAPSVQECDPGSHLAVTRRLIALRKAHPALRVGEVETLEAPPSVLALLRTRGDERVLCVINLAPKATTFSHPALDGGAVLDTGLSASLSGARLDLPAHGGAYVRAAAEG
ncbi:MAG: alpha-glucosidase family protein [Caulobacteraceae bacterium]|nr:alpha-glucosidase family protein [Caulobacteraceae bacterium]